MSKARLKKEEDYREYVGIEPGLQYANQQYISIDKDDMETKKFYVERVSVKIWLIITQITQSTI